MAKIHQLSQQLINQIAAGEVIERPSSVVKELLENSIDAGAHNIKIEIEYGGVRLIRISDDGEGMQRDDLLLSTKSHTTSKIQQEEDLHAIHSLGFRGEALASIASISHLQIQSCAAGESQAWKIFCKEEHESLIAIEPTSHPQGTTVEVRDLFYNTPVRRKFLRSDKTEFYHIENLVKNVSLSHFEVGFELWHNQRLVFKFQPARAEDEKRRRVEKVLNKLFLQQSATVEFTAVGLHLYGWVGLPNFERNQNDWQFFYVNGRMVRDRILNHAVKQAYQDLLYPGKQPSYILYLETELDALDVNVHPTKHEVRFRDQRLVHDFIFSNLYSVLQEPTERDKPRKSITSNITSLKPFNLSQLTLKETPVTSYRIPERKEFSHKINDFNQKEKIKKAFNFITRINEKVALARNEIGIVFIHLEKAQYALAYCQLKHSIKTQTVKSQPLLIPATIQLSENNLDYLTNNQLNFEKLGIKFTLTSETTATVRSLPPLLKNVELSQLFQALIKANLLLENIPLEAEVTHAYVHILASQVAKSSIYFQSNQELAKFLMDCIDIQDEHAKKYLKAATNTITLEQIDKMYT